MPFFERAAGSRDISEFDSFRKASTLGHVVVVERFNGTGLDGKRPDDIQRKGAERKRSGGIVGRYSSQTVCEPKSINASSQSIGQLRADFDALYRYLDERTEPLDAVARFQKLDVLVEGLCRDISTKINEACDGLKPTEAIVSALLSKEGDSRLSPSSIVIARRSVITFALQSVIGDTLCRDVFHLFHPAMDEKISKHFSNVYKNVRLQGPQRVSGRWRSSAFLAVDELESAGLKKKKNEVVEGIRHQWKTLSGVEIPSEFQVRLDALVDEAYAWNATVKSEVISFEFRLVDKTDDIDQQYMDVTNNYKSPNPEFFMVWPGLQSSQSEMESTWLWRKNIRVAAF